MRARGRRAQAVATVVASIAAAVGGVACSSGSTAGAPAVTTTSRARPTTVADSALEGDVAFLGPIATVPVGDVTVGFRQFGEGPDLLLICGQASSMSVWPATLLRSLSQRHRVTIYDNRDLGATATTSANFTLPDLADDAAGLISALGLRHPAVFGWSTGGEIGLLLAVRHPAALSSLFVTGATPGGPESVLPPPAIVDLFASANPDTGALLDVLFSPAGGAAEGAFISDYAKVPQPVLTPAAAAAYDAAERRYWKDPEPDLGAIRVPVLVANGAEDYAVPPANAEYIARRIGGNGRLEIDPGGRHGWFIEHPAHFEQVLSEFLARVRDQ